MGRRVKIGKVYFLQTDLSGVHWIKPTSFSGDRTNCIQSIHIDQIYDVKTDKMSDYLDKVYRHNGSGRIALYDRDIDIPLFTSYII